MLSVQNVFELNFEDRSDWTNIRGEAMRVRGMGKDTSA